MAQVCNQAYPKEKDIKFIIWGTEKETILGGKEHWIEIYHISRSTHSCTLNR